MTLKPSWAEGWFALATIHYDENHYDLAAQGFEKVIALQPHAGTALIMLGLCEFELGKDGSALRHIEEGERAGAADDPSLQQVALYHQGLILQRQSKFEEAQKALDALCRQGAASPDIFLALGMTALRRSDKNPPLDGQIVLSRLGEAQCLAAQKKLAEARQLYAALVSENPTLLNIHYAYGRLLLGAPTLDAALAEFEKEIQVHPSHVLARLQIAAAKYRVDSAGGLPYAEAAVKLDPNFPLGHYLLGVLLLDTDQLARALPELEAAGRMLPNDPRVHYSLALAYARAARPTDAQKEREAFQRLRQANGGGSEP